MLIALLEPKENWTDIYKVTRVTNFGMTESSKLFSQKLFSQVEEATFKCL